MATHREVTGRAAFSRLDSTKKRDSEQVIDDRDRPQIAARQNQPECAVMQLDESRRLHCNDGRLLLVRDRLLALRSQCQLSAKLIRGGLRCAARVGLDTGICSRHADPNRRQS